MSLNFPADPSDGDLYEGYIFDGTAGVWNSNPGQIISRFITSSSAPENPSEGDGWFDSTTAKSYTYYDGVWVQIGAPGTISFNQLDGIEVTDPVDGEIIVYDSASSQWVNESPITTFGGLEDTNISTPATGDSLVYNGSDWTNQPLSGRRNLLYNGAMQVHQRGTSVAAIANDAYNTADRWRVIKNNLGTFTQSIENDAPAGSGLAKSLKMLCTTAAPAPGASDRMILLQILEGHDVQSIAKGTSSAKSLTMSFWVKANVTGTYIVELFDEDNTRQISLSYSISSPGVWEKKIITFPADTTGAFVNDNSSSLSTVWWLGAGTSFTSGALDTVWRSSTTANRAVGQVNLAAATNNYWQITGVQLGVGPIETPFEFKAYGQELAECQRYYYLHHVAGNGDIGTGFYNSSTEIQSHIQFPVEMRAAPTGLVASATGLYNFLRAGGTVSVDNFSVFSPNRTVALLFKTGSPSGTAGVAGRIISQTSAGRIAFEAEL